jgi:hypothetical protein
MRTGLTIEAIYRLLFAKVIVFCRILLYSSAGLCKWPGPGLTRLPGAGQERAGLTLHFIRAVTVTYCYTLFSDSGWFAVKGDFQSRLGVPCYLPLGRLHITKQENAASTQKSWSFSTQTTVYHRFLSVLRLFILDGKQRAPENVR